MRFTIRKMQRAERRNKYNKLDHVPGLMSVVRMTKIIEGTRNGNLPFEVNPDRHSNRIEPGDDTNAIVKMLFA